MNRQDFFHPSSFILHPFQNMNLLDRLLIRSYLKAYVVCLVSLLSLYVVVDLFTNVDDFTVHHHGFEPNGIHITGERASRSQLVVRKFSCLIPEGIGHDLVHLVANDAYYYPPGEGLHTGGWLLTGTQPAELEGWNNRAVLEPLD